ncbi:endothelial cell-specific chemotaxis regulator-like isoform X2 [Heterodontus francisci]|uniref:endothelial cell-specific chemotaxis regulator-like isoform X2 n=1 Tax=Heterodontus francisci TaxID=7792 RepID=UPI00355B88AE
MRFSVATVHLLLCFCEALVGTHTQSSSSSPANGTSSEVETSSSIYDSGGPSLSLSDNSTNDSTRNGAPLGGFSTAKNLVLVLLLILAMVVLISLIVLRFKCRNYRKQRREAKGGTSDKTTTNKDQVTLISIRSTDTDIDEASSGRNDAVENGKVKELAQPQIHNQQRPPLN